MPTNIPRGSTGTARPSTSYSNLGSLVELRKAGAINNKRQATMAWSNYGLEGGQAGGIVRILGLKEPVRASLNQDPPARETRLERDTTREE